MRRSGAPAAGPPSLATPAERRLGRLEGGLLLAWLAAAGWLFFRPHEFILGAADAGVYVNLAANIAQSGAILIDDPTLAQLDPALYPAVLRSLPPGDGAAEVVSAYILPGLYVSDAAAGRITPQFYHLHPVWQAIGYALGGVRASLLLTGLWATLGALAIYLVARRLAGRPAAALALAGMSLNGLQIWFARYPTTEMLAQFLLWAGLWALLVWLTAGAFPARWGLLAGLLLGELFLVRIDMLLLLPLAAGLFAWLRLSGRWRPACWAFFGLFGLLAAHSLSHAWWQSRPYFYGLFGYALGLLARNPWLPALGLLAGAALFIALGRARLRPAGAFRAGRRARLLAIGALAALLIFAWFIRPNLAVAQSSLGDWYSGGQIPPGLDRENLVRLGWYLSPAGIALAAAGTGLLLWRWSRATAVILVVGLSFALIYLWRIQANPHQVYAMRRYLPAVVPFFILAAAYGLGWLWARPRVWARPLAGLLAGVWLAGLVWSARGLVSQVDHAGLIAAFERLDSRLPAGSVLLFNDQSPITAGDILGTPLRFLYGHDVFSLRRPDALDWDALGRQLVAWQAAGRSVFWLGDPEPAAQQGWQLGPGEQVVIRDAYLEGRYDRRPAAIISQEYALELRLIRALPPRG
ncbi:MAG: hypothetical protein ACRDHL_08320, partial [Candidatus Promineifilaceae bacterium]